MPHRSSHPSGIPSSTRERDSGRRLPLGAAVIIRRALCLAFVASVLHGGSAFAQTLPDVDGSSVVLEAPDPVVVNTTHRLEWHWKRIHWGEIAGAAGLAVGAIVIGQVVTPAARWTRTNAFDNWFRDRLEVNGTTRHRIDRTSDVLTLTLISFPVLVDTIGMTLIADRNKDVAGQLSVIQAQAFAMTGFLTNATKAAAGRERPWAQEQGCDALDLDCGRGANTAYFSGHTSFAFMGAGLTCVAHKHLELFGRVGDPLVCATTLTLASLTAVFRVMADAHWTTDVLTGAGVGLFTGWLMPWLLHFRHDTSRRDGGAARVLRYASPYGRSDEVGLSVAGTF